MKSAEQSVKQNRFDFITRLCHSPWPSGLIRFGLGGVFVYSGIIKLWAPKVFARTLSQYDLLPEALLPVAAIGLPVLELMAGIGVILAVRGSLSLMFSLLLLFTAVLWYGILKDLNVDCGCFSVEELKGQAGLRKAFYRDLVMLAAALFLFVTRWIQAGRNENLPFRVKIKRTL
ncbi:MAG: hypothetical protein C0407_00440 [Desulfobacca sp.]|nr:hypothetical protein [Desulfobacca sp.]